MTKTKYGLTEDELVRLLDVDDPCIGCGLPSIECDGSCRTEEWWEQLLSGWDEGDGPTGLQLLCKVEP